MNSAHWCENGYECSPGRAHIELISEIVLRMITRMSASADCVYIQPDGVHRRDDNRQRAVEGIRDRQQGSRAMGDKGKKDKAKGQKQKKHKQDQEAQKKLNKQPKRAE